MVCREGRIKTLKIDEVAWLLSTDIKTVQRWANAGIIKVCRITGSGKQMFRRDDVAHLLASLGV